MKINIAIGELVDKLTILSIKLDKISNPEKRLNIKKEFDLLKKSMASCGMTTSSEEFKQLKSINLKLWEIEDRIRNKEARKEFDNDFIQLARDIYFTNDERAALKRKINLQCNSEIIEEKEYVNYK